MYEMANVGVPAGRIFILFFYLKRYCKSGFCYLSREGQKIYHKGFAMQTILHHSYFA
jgi:hypothetical protein